MSKKNRQHNSQKKKGQRDKQRSTKYTHKTKDRVTRTPLKTGDELSRLGIVSSFCSTCGTHRVNLITHPVIRCYVINEERAMTMTTPQSHVLGR